MEHFRRLGFADEIRALGLPPDHPTDIAYFTRFASHELARIRLPTARRGARSSRDDDAAPGARPSCRTASRRSSSRPTLRRHAEALARQRRALRLDGWTTSATNGDAVAAPRSRPGRRRRGRGRARALPGRRRRRAQLRCGSSWASTGAARRACSATSWAGKMFAIYLRAPRFLRACCAHPRGLDVRRRQPAAARVHGRGRRRAASSPSTPRCIRARTPTRWTEADARRVFAEAVGAELPIEVLSMGTWLAGHCLVAERFQQGRVFIAGDAAHLFTPTGGLGYNTAVEDAVNLGWKLAPCCAASAPPALLESYEARAPAARAAQHRLRAPLRRLDRPVRAPSPSSRTRPPRGEAARAAAAGSISTRTRRLRVQHPRRHLRRPLRRLTGDRRRRHRTAARRAQRLRADRLPRRPAAACLAGRRQLALRPLRSGRLDPARPGAGAVGHSGLEQRGDGARARASGRPARLCGAARPLRRAARADPGRTRVSWLGGARRPARRKRCSRGRPGAARSALVGRPIATGRIHRARGALVARRQDHRARGPDHDPSTISARLRFSRWWMPNTDSM